MFSHWNGDSCAYIETFVRLKSLKYFSVSQSATFESGYGVELCEFGLRDVRIWTTGLIIARSTNIVISNENTCRLNEYLLRKPFPVAEDIRRLRGRWCRLPLNARGMKPLGLVVRLIDTLCDANNCQLQIKKKCRHSVLWIRCTWQSKFSSMQLLLAVKLKATLCICADTDAKVHDLGKVHVAYEAIPFLSKVRKALRVRKAWLVVFMFVLTYRDSFDRL